MNKTCEQLHEEQSEKIIKLEEDAKACERQFVEAYNSGNMEAYNVALKHFVDLKKQIDELKTKHPCQIIAVAGGLRCSKCGWFEY